MIKRVLGTCLAAAALTITGKMISNYAETKPALKNVKDKLKKTGQDFADDCKEVGLANAGAAEGGTMEGAERRGESCQSQIENPDRGRDFLFNNHYRLFSSNYIK